MSAIARSLGSAALCLSLSMPTLSAQQTTDASGHWEGVLQSQNGGLPVQFDLAKDAQGRFRGTTTTVGLRGFPLVDVETRNDEIAFHVGSGLSARVFVGALSGDGSKISGTFTQQGFPPMALELVRRGDARIEEAPVSAAVATELEGTWRGDLRLGANDLHMRVTLTNRPDGTAGGLLLNLDEDGALEIPITTITQRDKQLVPSLEVRTVPS